MPEVLSIIEELSLIQVISYGDVTHDDFKLTLKAILDIREERGVDRVLVDTTGVKSLPTSITVFEFGAQTAGVLLGVKIAIIAIPGTRKEAHFFETVARNRGGMVRSFKSSREALGWLL